MLSRAVEAGKAGLPARPGAEQDSLLANWAANRASRKVRQGSVGSPRLLIGKTSFQPVRGGTSWKLVFHVNRLGKSESIWATPRPGRPGLCWIGQSQAPHGAGPFQGPE